LPAAKRQRRSRTSDSSARKNKSGVLEMDIPVPSRTLAPKPNTRNLLANADPLRDRMLEIAGRLFSWSIVDGYFFSATQPRK
jgi:hypothetical protein